MSDLTFVVEECQLDSEMDDYFYVCPAFNIWQSRAQGKRLQTFGIFRKDTKQLYARLTLAGKGGEWSVPVTGTFGGPVLLRKKDVPVHALDSLIVEVTRWLKQEARAQRCFIRLPPTSFPDRLTGLTLNVLFRNGWILDQVDINYHLSVMPPDAFHSQLGATKRQETRRLKGSRAEFCTIPAQEAERAYEIIAHNRSARGYPMTMSWAAVASLAEAFPAKIHFFGVRRGSELLAASICIEVTNSYFYVFYWGEAPQFRKEMPVLLLAEGLVHYCHENSFTVIDIGTSSDRSMPNEGLIGFKAGLGFQPSPKLTLRYDFC